MARRCHTPRPDVRRRGAALILVIIALVFGVIVSVSFLRSSATSTAIAANVDRHALARHVAESGLQTVLATLETDDTWRQTFNEGQWLVGQSFAGGTYAVWGFDGADLDGDGIIDNGDGNLADDGDDPVTIRVVGTVDGVTYTAQAVLQPAAGGGPRLAMIVRNPDALLPREQGRRDLIEGWGWTVILVDDQAPDATFAALPGQVDVVYALDVVGSERVGQLLDGVACGVVFEDGPTGRGLRLGTAITTVTATVLDVLDNTHGITTGLPVGTVAMTTGDVAMEAPGGSLAEGDRLVRGEGGAVMVLATEAEANGANGQPVAGRRASSPFAAADVEDLTPYGERLLRQTLQWASGQDPLATPQTVVLYEFEPTYDPPTLVGHWTLDEATAPGGGGVALGDRLYLNSGAMVDAYDSAEGVYNPARIYRAVVATNGTGWADVYMNWGGAKLYADVAVGPGGNPNTVIYDPSGASYDGTSTTLATPVAVVAPEPTGSFKNDNWNGPWNRKQVINRDTRFNGNLHITNNQKITIQGHVRIDVTGDFEMMSNGSQLIIPDDSSLELYVQGNATLGTNCSLGNSSDRTNQVMLSLYGSDSRLFLNNPSQIYGSVYVNGDVELNTASEIYGSVVASDDISLNSSSRIHVDRQRTSIMGVVTGDDAADNDGYGSGVSVGHDGQIGLAHRFNGGGATIISHDDRYLIDAGAVSLWFKPDSVRGDQGLFSKDSYWYDTGGHLSVRLEDNEVVVRLQSDRNSYYVSANGIHADRWHHVAVSFGPSGLRLYIDGVLRDTDAYTGGLGPSSGDIGNHEPIALGADTQYSGDGVATPLSDYFTGLMDDVRIYSGELDTQQASNLAQGLDPGLPSAPGARLADTSGYGQPVDLYVDLLNRITFVDDAAVHIDAPVTIASPGAATKIRDRLASTGGFALEMRLTPDDLTQAGPARLLTYTDAGGTEHNVLAGQEGGRLAARVRTTSTTVAGTPTVTSDPAVSGDAEHWVITYGDEAVSFFRNGTLVGTQARSGSLDTWDAAMKLVLANEAGGGYPWLGTLDRVAIYDRPMTPAMARDLSQGHLPGVSAAGTSMRATWIERP